MISASDSEEMHDITKSTIIFCRSIVGNMFEVSDDSAGRQSSYITFVCYV